MVVGLAVVGEGYENIIVTVGWDHRVTTSLVFLRKAYGGNLGGFTCQHFLFLMNGRGKLNYPSKVFLFNFWRSESQKKKKIVGKTGRIFFFFFHLFPFSNDDERKK